MGAKDTITKEYMQNAEIFADAFNFFMYDGEQVIKPEELHELDTTSIALPYGDDNESETVQKFRDILKMAAAMKDSYAAYLILGIENQTGIHYAMPVRDMLYDAMEYSDQVNKAAKSHRKAKNAGNSQAEYLSGFYKTDKLLPVVTLVVYFGASEWDAPRSIHEMLLIKDKRILSFVPDYKINLIAPQEIANEDFSKFKTELSVVLKYIKYSKDKTLLNAVLHEDEAFRKVTRQTAEVINTVTNSKLEFNNGEESIDMCKAIEDMIDDATKKCREESIAEERERLANNLRKMGLSEEQIQTALES